MNDPDSLPGRAFCLRQALSAAIFCFLFGFPALRAIFKYGPDGIAAGALALLYAVIVGALALVSWRRPQTLRPVFSSPGFYVAVALLLAALVWLLYPVADGLKLQGRGSDQDDCVIQGVQFLLAGQSPYAGRSYLGNLCSTGPGVLAVYLPFVLLKVYPLGAVVFLCLSQLYVYRARGSQVAGFYTLALLGNPLVLELLVTGSDLFFIAFGLVLVALFLERPIGQRPVRAVVAMAVLSGLIASSRIFFVGLVPWLALAVWPRGARSAGWHGRLFVLLAAAVGLLPGLLLFAANPEGFAPLHLLDKSGRLLGDSAMLLLGAAVAVLALLAAQAARQKRLPMSMALLWVLGLPLTGLCIAGLQSVGWRPGLSEHFNYLLPVMPLAALAAFTDLVRKNGRS